VITKNQIPTSSKLILRTATESLEISQLRRSLDQEHYLKAGRPAGHVLWQGIYRTNPDDDTPTLIAVLCWGGAAKRLKARDLHIGWDSVTCANRLKLVVQLRRFLVLDAVREPNLASQCLAISLKSIATEWEKAHGFQPLLAESFHDPNQHTGTLYKATNWTPLGLTKGFKRHRADFYQDTKTPKQLWIKPLKKQSLYLLCQPHALPSQHQKGISEATAGARSPLTNDELRSLRKVFYDLPDPRFVKTKRHPLSGLLTLLSFGLICGASNVKSIWKKCGALNESQSLAIDGKDLGGKGNLGAIVSLIHHTNGQP
jgi:hypothetical protein